MVAKKEPSSVSLLVEEKVDMLELRMEHWMADCLVDQRVLNWELKLAFVTVVPMVDL